MEKKFFACDVKSEDENRSVWFTASTEDRDRDGDVIVLSGWKLDNYLKNPVFLWAHDYSRPPIGKGVAVSTDGKLEIKVQFVPKEIDPFAEQIYHLYKAGIMSTVSVGFMPYKVDALSEADLKQRPEMKYGRRISAELLELSAVPVPSNPNALSSRDMAEVMAKGFNFGQSKENEERVKSLLENVSQDLAAIKACLK